MAAFWSAWVFQDQLREMRTQTKQSLDSFRIDEQASVGLDKPLIAEKLNFPGPSFTRSGPDGTVHQPDNPNPLIHTSLSLKNFGKTPAFNVVAQAFSSNIDMIDVESKTMCQFAEDASSGKAVRDGPRQDIKWEALGVTIFPGQTFVTPKDVPGGDIPRLFIVGCIAYRDAFNRRHKTRFCYKSPQIIVTDPAMKNGDAFVQCNIYNDAE